MRNHSKKITADRLGKALADHGVSLKRGQLIEVLARTFGLLDSNDLAAAADRGEIDPPTVESIGSIVATHPAMGGIPLILLKDPSTDRIFAVDDEENAKSGDRYLSSPYGGLLRLRRDAMHVIPITQDANVRDTISAQSPDTDYVSPAMVDGVPSDARRSIQRHSILNGIPKAFGEYAELISEESFGTGVDTVPFLTPNVMAIVDGEPHIGFSYEEEYEYSEVRDITLNDLVRFRSEHLERIQRANGLLRWYDDPVGCTIRVEILLPTRLCGDVDSLKDWQDAAKSLLDSGDVTPCIARFQPQVWRNDYATDVDAMGPDKYDVSFEILMMGSEAAGRITDNSDESDMLSLAVKAPSWVRNWIGTCIVRVEDDVHEFIESRRHDDADDLVESAIETATAGLLDLIERVRSDNADVVERFARLLDEGDEHVEEIVEDAIDDLKDKVGSTAANQVDDDRADETILAVETWITDNVSNATAATRIAAVFFGLGTDEAVRILSDRQGRGIVEGGRDPEPTVGTSATMPDERTTVLIDHVTGRNAAGGWDVLDEYGEPHLIEFDDDRWNVVVPSVG